MAAFFYVIKSNKESKKGISSLNELSNPTVLYVFPFQTISILVYIAPSYWHFSEGAFSWSRIVISKITRKLFKAFLIFDEIKHKKKQLLKYWKDN